MPTLVIDGAAGRRRRRRPRHRRRRRSWRSSPGEVLGLVGESGSGKTTVGLAVLGHARKGVPDRTADRSRINGREMLGLAGASSSGGPAGDLVSATSPRTRARPSTRRCASASSCMEVLEHHDFGGSDEARRRPRRRGAWPRCSCRRPAQFLRRYPHQLSGGQQQRVGLAMAFACRPAVIVLDEPTTGLDVSTQAHVLETVRDLCRRHGVAALYVTHDLAVVANLADRVAVMYAGRVVEQGPTAAIFARPGPSLLPAPDRRRARHHRHRADRRAAPAGRRPRGAGPSAARSRRAASSPPTSARPPSRRCVEVAAGHTVRCVRPWTEPAPDGGRPRALARTDRAGRRRARRADGVGVVRRPPGRARHRPPRRAAASASPSSASRAPGRRRCPGRSAGLHHEWTGADPPRRRSARPLRRGTAASSSG